MMKWVYCPVCRHKLFLADMGSNMLVEIKCHSCKAVEVVNVSNGKIRTREKEPSKLPKELK